MKIRRTDSQDYLIQVPFQMHTKKPVILMNDRFYVSVNSVYCASEIRTWKPARVFTIGGLEEI